MRLYSLLDRKMKQHGAIVQAKQDAEVLRNLGEAVNSVDPKSMLARYPGDFDLYYLGVFDVERGLIRPEQVPVLVKNCGELKLDNSISQEG